MWSTLELKYLQGVESLINKIDQNSRRVNGYPHIAAHVSQPDILIIR